MTKHTISVMGKTGMGGATAQMKRQIRRIRAELEDLGEPEAMPEMILSTNLLRANEHLSRSGKKKSELLAAYGEYTEHLESLVSSLFEIQGELKEILKAQSALISTKPSKRTRKPGK